ncbi:WD repeat domain phosphoinositide-interacting protein 2-like isoform X1 [Argiope bruennichi]|uniref:WD repeat domain phosphoinositide-interacting protein 2-like isoform X1 n=2 Tax=Argiope bruennichi TaxID=94029 RepID=UPI0024940A60|nr:WD repeat domain phosphoinositide-interacting protein 2-like isoform X1 [Argiope bruennichi]
MADSRDFEASKEILYVSFNQTATGLNIGSKTGYTSYDLNTTNEVIPTFDSPTDIKDVRIVERVFSTSLIAYVQLEKPRTLVLIHHVKGLVIIEKSFPNTILSVRMNRTNVVVCLEDRIFIISIKNLTQTIHEITNTQTNEKGLIALTYGEEKKPSFLAYPGSSTIGNVQIFDTIGMHAKITIPAHNSALAALAFDESGEKIATASIKGTVIRIFSVAKGEQLYEFRRGVKRCAEINCLSFCKNPELLCVSSNTETIHIFKLTPSDVPQPAEEEETEGWMEMFNRLVTQSAKLLPTQMSGVLTQQRSFAHVHLPFVSKSTISAISFISNIPYVVVTSLEGFLYIYDINMDTGGPCQLVKQYRLEGPPPKTHRSPDNNHKKYANLDSQKIQEHSLELDDKLQLGNVSPGPSSNVHKLSQALQDENLESNTTEGCSESFPKCDGPDTDTSQQHPDYGNINGCNGVFESCDYFSTVNYSNDSNDALPPILTQVEP